MLFYILSTEQAAIDLIAAIDALVVWPPGNVTNCYTVPLKHVTLDLWAIPADAGGVPTEEFRVAGDLPEGTPEPAELPESWTHGSDWMPDPLD